MISKTKEGAASAAPSTPAEAEQLVLEATTPEEAHRLYLFCADQESGWQAARLRAERRLGELLGPVVTGRGNKVSHDAKVYDKDTRSRARKVAAVPQSDFDEYLRTDSKPTRKGLLRKYGAVTTAQPIREPKPRKTRPTPAGKRMHAAKLARADAKRNGRPVPFWEIGWEVSRLVYGLASWKVEDVPLDYDNLNAMTTVEEDLLYLYDWMDETLNLIHSRMGEHGMRQQLRKLQARTVENGCTPEEAANAARAVKRLQRKIDNALEAAV